MSVTVSSCVSPGHPVSQPEQEVLRSQPAVSQQHWRFSPPPHKLHHRYLSGHPQGLPVPPPCLLHPTPTSPVHPLPPHCCLQCTMVRSGSRSVKPTAWASTGQHLPAAGPLPRHGWWAGPDSRSGAAPGFPSDQLSPEVRQQPGRTQHEDHVGPGERAGLNPGRLDRTGVEQSVPGPDRLGEDGGTRAAWRARRWKGQKLTASRTEKIKQGMKRSEEECVEANKVCRDASHLCIHPRVCVCVCVREKQSRDLHLFDWVCVWQAAACSRIKEKTRESNVKRPKRC